MFFCRLATLSRIILLLRKCSPRSQNNHVFISDASYKYICIYYVCTYNYLCHSLQEHFTIKVKLKRKLREGFIWLESIIISFFFCFMTRPSSIFAREQNLVTQISTQTPKPAQQGKEMHMSWSFGEIFEV